VYAGETPVYSGEAGTTYTFLGWTDAATEPGAAATYYTVLPAADGNATYYAYFGAQQNTYTVDFVIDGQTISKTFPYGATPALGYTPVKAADADYTYSFTGWTPAIETVTGDAAYTAVFEPTAIPVTPTLYLVKAQAGEGTKINDVTGLYEANDTVTLTVSVDEAYSQRTPTVAVNGATLRVVDPVSGVYTYTITVEGATDITVSDLTKNTYDVAFKDYDGSPLDTVTVEWGEDAAYPGSDPIRPADENYVYTFTGWDVSLNNIKAATVAKAVYQQSPVGSHTHQFTINSFDETGHWMACACGERQDFAAHVMETKHDAAGHWTECACGCRTAKADHVFDEEVASGAATCAAPAYSEMKCACGETKRTESGDVDLTRHAGAIRTFGARAATETLDGYTGDKYCLACGNLVEAGQVIPHTGSTEEPATPEGPAQPDNGGTVVIRISFLDWLRNFIQKLVRFFKSFAGTIC
ncbi:MAG: hypothetical protein IJK98_12390, partial [Clostridia bacterium]|nr:hypothetical protein [Clostridia bacterium]